MIKATLVAWESILVREIAVHEKIIIWIGVILWTEKKDLIIQYVLQPSTDAFRHVCFVLVAYLLSHIKSYCVLVIQTCTFIHLLCSHIISLSCCCNTLISAWGMNKNVSYLILSILQMHWFSTWSFAGSKLICPKRSARNVSHKSWRVLKHYKEYTFV